MAVFRMPVIVTTKKFSKKIDQKYPNFHFEVQIFPIFAILTHFDPFLPLFTPTNLQKSQKRNLKSC